MRGDLIQNENNVDVVNNEDIPLTDLQKELNAIDEIVDFYKAEMSAENFKVTLEIFATRDLDLLSKITPNTTGTTNLDHHFRFWILSKIPPTYTKLIMAVLKRIYPDIPLLDGLSNMYIIKDITDYLDTKDLVTFYFSCTGRLKHNEVLFFIEKIDQLDLTDFEFLADGDLSDEQRAVFATLMLGDDALATKYDSINVLENYFLQFISNDSKKLECFNNLGSDTQGFIDFFYNYNLSLDNDFETFFVKIGVFLFMGKSELLSKVALVYIYSKILGGSKFFSHFTSTGFVCSDERLITFLEQHEYSKIPILLTAYYGSYINLNLKSFPISKDELIEYILRNPVLKSAEDFLTQKSDKCSVPALNLFGLKEVYYNIEIYDFPPIPAAKKNNYFQSPHYSCERWFTDVVGFYKDYMLESRHTNHVDDELYNRLKVIEFSLNSNYDFYADLDNFFDKYELSSTAQYIAFTVIYSKLEDAIKKAVKTNNFDDIDTVLAEKFLTKYPDFVDFYLKNYKEFQQVGKVFMTILLPKFGDKFKFQFVEISLIKNAKLLPVLAYAYNLVPSFQTEIISAFSSKNINTRKTAFALLKAIDLVKFLPDINAAIQVESNAKFKEEMQLAVFEASNLPNISSDNLPEENKGSEKSAKVSAKTKENSKDVAEKNATKSQVSVPYTNSKNAEFTDNNSGFFKDKESLILLLKQGKSIKEIPVDKFTKIKSNSGVQVEIDIVKASLIAFAKDKVTGFCPLADAIVADFDPITHEFFAKDLFNFYYENGAKTKDKWVLYYCSIYGGVAMLDLFLSAIKEFTENSRSAFAGETVRALSLNNSPQTLSIIEEMSRKSKNKTVKKSANLALDFVASELQITLEELADKIVPKFDFDENMTISYSYGTRIFTAFLTPTLELEITDEKGKVMKNLPRISANDDPLIAQKSKDDFSAMKKQIKTTVATQMQRLDLALAFGRTWSYHNFIELFVQNPIMYKFATTLIWGTYENGILIDTFRYMDDGSFNTPDEDEFILNENMQIGLIHPTELSPELLETWSQQLDDYEIKQPILQLNRPIFTPEKSQIAKHEITFDDTNYSTLSLNSKMSKLGIKPPIDASWFSSIEKDIPVLDYSFILHFSGMSHVYDMNVENCTLNALVFYKGTEFIKIKDTPAKFISEVLYAISMVVIKDEL